MKGFLTFLGKKSFEAWSVSDSSQRSTVDRRSRGKTRGQNEGENEGENGDACRISKTLVIGYKGPFRGRLGGLAWWTIRSTMSTYHQAPRVFLGLDSQPLHESLSVLV